MTKTLFTFAATLTILTSLAVGQTNFTATKAETATVPFSFTAGDRTFPAGVYTVQLDHEKQILLLRGENQKPLMLLANNQESREAAKKSQLVFHRVGEHFFLREAWLQGSHEGQRLLPGSYEKEIARHQTEAAQTITVQAQAR